MDRVIFCDQVAQYLLRKFKDESQGSVTTLRLALLGGEFRPNSSCI